jgi:hypothetical protein
VGSKKADSLHWVQSCIDHPMMCLTQEREVLGTIVAGVVVEVSNRKTSLDL